MQEVGHPNYGEYAFPSDCLRDRRGLASVAHVPLIVLYRICQLSSQRMGTICGDGTLAFEEQFLCSSDVRPGVYCVRVPGILLL